MMTRAGRSHVQVSFKMVYNPLRLRRNNEDRANAEDDRKDNTGPVHQDLCGPRRHVLRCACIFP